MPRKKVPRVILSQPEVTFFKPQGVCLQQLEITELYDDEFEALKLHNFDGFSQIEAAKAMKISQPTFGRILNSAYKKISEALFEGKAIAIQKVKKGAAYESIQGKRHFNYFSATCDVCDRHCLVD